MTEYEQEQEMEIEALQAILMDDFTELEAGQTGGLSSTARCFQIEVSPMGDDEDEPTEIPVRLGLCFAHTPKYPDEPPLLSVRSLQGVNVSDIQELEDKLKKEVEENLGMAMMYTLATSAKDWLREKFGGEQEEEEDEEEEKKEEVIEAHGLPVTVETFVEWRDTFEAELALEQAKLMPEASLLARGEKRMTGRQWFESGAHMQRGVSRTGVVTGGEDEDEFDFDDEFEDEDEDEEDMLEHYLAEKIESA